MIIFGRFAGFDTGLLLSAAYHSELAYQGFDDIPGALAFRNRLTFTQAYLVPDGNIDVLVFPGTLDWFDFIVDVAALPPIPYGNGWCHPGFAGAHRSVWKEVRAAIRPDRELLVTGHSLGGGLAEKSADFLRDHRAPVHLITFGKPNLHMRGHIPSLRYLATQLSVVHGSDIITRLPRYLYGPDPGQDMLYFDNTSHAHFNPERSFMRLDMGRRDILKDHFMAGYSTRVGQLVRESPQI